MIPHTATDIQKVEAVQRRAARWVYMGIITTLSVSIYIILAFLSAVGLIGIEGSSTHNWD